MNKKFLPSILTASLLAAVGGGAPVNADLVGGIDMPAARELTERDQMYIARAQAKRERKGAKRLAALAHEQRVTEERRAARELRARRGA